MSRSGLIVTLCGLLVLSSCNDLGTNLMPRPTGSYVYTSYDSLGSKIVQGWFTLIIADSTHISGEWHFTQVGGGNAIGPQVGDGKLVGGFRSALLWVELNPQFVDHNLQLVGTLSATAYSGTWCAIGYMGIYNHGTFQASRD